MRFLVLLSASLCANAQSQIKCDGITDNQTVFQAALNGGRVLLLPPGQCNYSGTLALPPKAQIVGAGSGNTTLRKTGHGAAIQISGADAGHRITDTKLDGFTLQGDGGSFFAGDYGIVYHHANSHHLMSDVVVTQSRDVGLFFKGDCFEIRGYALRLSGVQGPDSILYQQTPDSDHGAANDITLFSVYIISNLGRAVHFTNSGSGNFIYGLSIQSPSAAIEAIKFEGSMVKWNHIYGAVGFDEGTATAAPAMVVFDAATDNELIGFHTAMTGVPVFSFVNSAARNVIMGAGSNGTPTAIYATSTDAAVETISGWTTGSVPEVADSNLISNFNTASYTRFPLPISCSGHPAGTFWNNSGTMSICP